LALGGSGQYAGYKIFYLLTVFTLALMLDMAISSQLLRTQPNSTQCQQPGTVKFQYNGKVTIGFQMYHTDIDNIWYFES
jgi:hypothetical protein